MFVCFRGIVVGVAIVCLFVDLFDLFAFLAACGWFA